MTWRTELSYPLAGRQINEVQADVEHAGQDITNTGVGVGNAKPVEVDGKPYYVSYGYYIPHYEQKKGDEAFTQRDSIITELTNRIDRCAYTDRDQQYNWEQIKKLEALYDAAPAQSKFRQSYGAQLVHGSLDLMKRIDRALLDHREIRQTIGRSLIQSTANLGAATEGYNEQPPEAQKAIREQLRGQLRELYSRLDKDTELVSQMRRQNRIRHRGQAIRQFGSELYTVPNSSKALSPQFDTTGVLHDMIREVGKAASFLSEGGANSDKEQTTVERTSSFIEQAKIQKLGKALQCVDAIKARLDAVCASHAVFSRMPTGHNLQLMADTARAIIALGSNDVPHVWKLEAQYNHLVSSLNNDHRVLREAINDPRSKAAKALMAEGIRMDEAERKSVGLAIDSIEFGFDLIADMVRTRLPCSEIYWPDGQEPSGVPEKSRAKVDSTRLAPDDQEATNERTGLPMKPKTLASDPNHVDPRSDLALFEKFSDMARNRTRPKAAWTERQGPEGGVVTR